MPSLPPVSNHAVLSALVRGAVAVALTFPTGCANVDQQPTLVYPHTDTQAVGPRHKQIILTPFLDHRADKTNVGTVDKAFGLSSTQIVPANDVKQWVMEAVKTELQNSGYTVTEGSTPKDTLPGASAAVTGVIVDVSCNSSDSGKVELIGKIRRAGTEVLNKKYAANGSAKSPFKSTSETCAQSLTVALSASIKRFVADVDGMLGG